MILTCPSCGTQYVVKDGAIPPQGRQVRCASCKHKWHQDPDPGDPQPVDGGTELPGAVPPAEQSDQTAHDDSAASAVAGTDEGYDAEPQEQADFGAGAAVGMAPGIPVAPPSEMLHEAASGDGPAAAVAEEEYRSDPVPQEHGAAGEPMDYHFSPFADQEPLEDEGRKPWLKVLLGLLLIAAVAAAFWFLAPPAWKARLGLAGAGETPLQLMMTHSDRQRLASGQEMLSISGRVINPTEKSQRVPPIQAQLRSRTGQLVYSWTIPAPTPRLGPGESKPFNDAKLDVPSGGDDLTISLGVRGV